MNSNARAKVLVVEDSLAVAKRLQLSLERAGFLVETARNGRQAHTMALKKKYDVVVTDEQMPIMSGRDFCRQLRSDSHYQHTPVIFLTAKDSDLDANELSEELGVTTVFGKPFNPEVVMHRIEKELQPCSISMLKSRVLDAGKTNESVKSACTQTSSRSTAQAINKADLCTNSSGDGLRATVDYLFNEAKRDSREKRSCHRESFFKHVSVAFVEDGDVRCYSCFSRDISPSGIGLLHYMPLDLGEVIVTIYSDSLGPIRLKGEIAWCQPCGDGWFISGAKFLETLGASPR